MHTPQPAFDLGRLRSSNHAQEFPGPSSQRDQVAGRRLRAVHELVGIDGQSPDGPGQFLRIEADGLPSPVVRTDH